MNLGIIDLLDRSGREICNYQVIGETLFKHKNKKLSDN
jgi:hypothetical protein